VQSHAEDDGHSDGGAERHFEGERPVGESELK
jgi:hypothetical protein